jgi:CheY-like chemotaxis protein/HPt (histidine-containing phosphotransfer) domain-containing protein
LLVVEDDATSRMYLQTLLEQHGFRVTVAATGDEALRETETGEFELILMDIQMPGMDGLEATRAIRQRQAPNRRRTPIIGITAHALQRDRQRCLDAGMDGHLSKPVDAGSLLAVAGRFLGREPDPAAENHARLDLPKLLGHLGGDRQVLGSMVTIFLETGPRTLAKIREAVAAGDPKGVAAAAHAIRGSAGIFGATALAELCLQIENLGEAGELAAVTGVLREFEAELGEVTALMKESV